jgi:hypothetical protein
MPRSSPTATRRRFKNRVAGWAGWLAAGALCTAAAAQQSGVPLWSPKPEQNAAYGIALDLAQGFPGSPFPIAIVGSYLRNSVDPPVTNAGAAYILRWLGTPIGWEPEAELVAAQPVANTYFGRSVAALRSPSANADFAFVGAYRDAQLGPGRGAVHPYSAVAGKEWTSGRVIRPVQGALNNEWFGFSLATGHVAASGTDTLLVGAPRGRRASFGQAVGTVYVYERQGAAWVLIAKLGPAAGAAVGDGFGWSSGFLPNIVTGPAEVPIDPVYKLVAIGAPGNFNNRGRLFFFELRANDLWINATQRVRNPPGLQPGDRYGEAVAAAKRFVAAGAPGRGDARGAVFIWERTGVNTATLVATLQPAGLLAEDRFGSAVAMAEQPDGSVLLAVGARGDDTLATAAGAVYLYRWSSGFPAFEWEFLGKRFSSTAATGNQFGFSVAAGAEQALAGSPFLNAPAQPPIVNSGSVERVAP